MKNLYQPGKLVAEKFLRLKAFYVQIDNPFTWANGWQSPLFFDDRKILSYTYARNLLKLEIGRLVAEHFPDVDVISGVAVNSIASGLLVAEQLNMPYIYIFPAPKTHGLENQVEGDLRPRQKVILIINQIHEGNDALSAIEVLRNNACIPEAIITIFDLQLPIAKQKLKETGVPVFSLTTFTDVMQVAKDNNLFTEIEIDILEKWHKNPNKWIK